MWHFVSPQIVFGDSALEALNELHGERALVVTDSTLVELGLADRVVTRLHSAGIDCQLFDGVEPEPSVQTIHEGARIARDVAPDWIVGLGGGSPMDAAKAIWVLYERPDLEPADINPFIDLGLRQKARLITIPTTSGTGAEVTWAIVLTDTAEQRKMGLGNRENVADMAIVDPEMAAGMPPQLTADTGLDALAHAVEAYICTWHTDVTDGLCLQAARDVFRYLPRAVADGTDMEARERMHHAATCAGLGFGNAMASLAHAMGHALGAGLGVAHGRAVGLCLPYTIEYAAAEVPGRCADLAQRLGLTEAGGEAGARALATAVRRLVSDIGNPTSVSELPVMQHVFEQRVEKMIDDAFSDTQIITAPRSPSYEDLAELFLFVFEGRVVDF